MRACQLMRAHKFFMWRWQRKAVIVVIKLPAWNAHEGSKSPLKRGLYNKHYKTYQFHFFALFFEYDIEWFMLQNIYFFQIFLLQT